ncbi:hypothetical protein A3Q56_04582 [Intoshia linei]|uniref:DNA mismatch repair proteins mutS family domain-containing protein n=1 Tax=Intoshia linei TaxID=1819745 RepID=A0A177B2Q1_9BILA|nr:hypothetical protein A3Q56_04582 [Intoshia linei]
MIFRCMHQEIPEIKNYYMNAITANDQFTLLYKLKEGVSSDSFGINVAKLVKFPDNVIEMANKKLTSFHYLPTTMNKSVKKNGLASLKNALIEVKQYNGNENQMDKLENLKNTLKNNKFIQTFIKSVCTK